MPKDNVSEAQARLELSRAKQLAKASEDVRDRALKLVKQLESEEIPDLKDISTLHRKLSREEKALSKLLKPVPRKIKKKNTHSKNRLSSP